MMTETPERPEPETLDICRDCDGSGEDGTPAGVCSRCNGSGGTPRSSALASSLGEPVSQEAPVISSASPLSEEALRLAFLAGVEDAVGPERCGAEYDAPSREYARRAVARLSASAPSPEDTRQAPGFLTDADIASLPEWK